jgi:VIT1/CCC1 family predicted Fe2+/Mn2+ transporter
MGLGEYVSVSTQLDTEKAMLESEREEINKNPDFEFQELASMYKQKGLSDQTALAVARELTAHDAFGSHVEAELGIDPNDLTNPWHAAFASTAAFFCGALFPIIMAIVSPARFRIPIIFCAVVVALIITGTVSAHAGEAKKSTAIIRIVIGGMLAMAITYGIGKLFGISGI